MVFFFFQFFLEVFVQIYFFLIVCIKFKLELDLINIFLILFLSQEEIANSDSGASGSHPLLSPCLKGLGKFSHLIDLDFMGDLMIYLRKLASGSGNSGNCSQKNSKYLTVSERLQCCIIAFRVMRSNLDALNVDLHEFFVQLYNIMLEYSPGRLVAIVLIRKPCFGNIYSPLYLFGNVVFYFILF